MRIVLGTLRLGVAEMTLLNGLSLALTGSKAAKPILEMPSMCSRTLERL